MPKHALQRSCAKAALPRPPPSTPLQAPSTGRATASSSCPTPPPASTTSLAGTAVLPAPLAAAAGLAAAAAAARGESGGSRRRLPPLRLGHEGWRPLQLYGMCSQRAARLCPLNRGTGSWSTRRKLCPGLTQQMHDQMSPCQNGILARRPAFFVLSPLLHTSLENTALQGLQVVRSWPSQLCSKLLFPLLCQLALDAPQLRRHHPCHRRRREALCHEAPRRRAALRRLLSVPHQMPHQLGQVLGRRLRPAVTCAAVGGWAG